MMRPFPLRWLIPFTLVVLLLAGCSDSGDEAADTTLAPTTTAAVTTTSAAAPSTTAAPATTTSITTAGPTKMLANGDFETGDLTEWTKEFYSAGSFGGWFVYEDGTTPPTGAPRLYAFNVFEVSDPPQGQYAAVTDGNSAGLRILYQDFTVNGPSVLHATVFYRTTFSPGFGYGETRIIAPDSLRTAPNQQYRVDLIDPEAPIDSVADENVLATVFRTIEGDPVTLEPTEVTFDLSPWDGQTIRLRFAQVDSQGRFFAGVDDVRIEPSD